MNAVRFRINSNGAEIMVNGKWQENTNLLADSVQGMKAGLLPGPQPRGAVRVGFPVRSKFQHRNNHPKLKAA